MFIYNLLLIYKMAQPLHQLFNKDKQYKFN
jgi:hypothetical protein